MIERVIAVFGGSFDPPHRAHLQTIELVLGNHLASELLLVPCIRHVFGKSLSAFHHRVEMCRLLCEELPDTVRVSQIEDQLDLSGYMIDTLRALSDRMPGAQLRLVVGSDILAQSQKWRDFELVRSLAPLIVVAREGFASEQADLPAPAPVSSTIVRQMVGSGDGPAQYVTPAVLEYIERHGLYASD